MAWAAAAVVSSFRPPTLSLPHSNLRRNYSVRRVQAPRFRVGVGAAPRFRVGVVAAQQTDIFKVLGTIWKTSKDVLDTGSKLVPESVPRPVARVGVAIGGFVAMLFILKSVLSTALFILAVMGLIYLVFIYWNKDEAPRRSTKEEDGSIDESLEEARRIMEKYK